MNNSTDEIDIKVFIAEVLRRWKFILGIGLLTAVLALLISLLFPENYKAEATVFLPRSRSDLSLASQFQTVNDPVDSASRLDGIIAISESDEVARNTLDSIAPELAPEEWTVDEIQDVIDIVNVGDAILVRAVTEDSALSATIANRWAEFSVNSINQAFRMEQATITEENQVQQAQSGYLLAQGELENFINNNEIETLTLRLQELDRLISELATDRSERLSFLLERKHGLERLVVEGRYLRDQLEAGTQSIAGALGDAIAVLVARATALNFQTQVPESDLRALADLEDRVNPPLILQSPSLVQPQQLSIDVQLSDLEQLQDSSGENADDLTNLIETAERGVSDLEMEIEQLAAEMLDENQSDVLDDTLTEIRALETALEGENARKLVLESNRDLAWSAYQVLLQKETELRSESQTGERVVLASRAIPPDEAESRGTIRNVAIAGLFGSAVATGWVVLRYWWSDEPEEDGFS